MPQPPSPGHAPCTRPGACDPCRNGDHAGCWSVAPVPSGVIGHELDQCTCYDGAWEWHETIGGARTFGPSAQPGRPA